MKFVKRVCTVLLALSGVNLAFVGAVSSWQSVTSGQLTGLILMLPTAALGVGLIWLDVRLLRGRPGKQAQEQEKDEREEREKPGR